MSPDQEARFVGAFILIPCALALAITCAVMCGSCSTHPKTLLDSPHCLIPDPAKCYEPLPPDGGPPCP